MQKSTLSTLLPLSPFPAPKHCKVRTENNPGHASAYWSILPDSVQQLDVSEIIKGYSLHTSPAEDFGNVFHIRSVIFQMDWLKGSVNPEIVKNMLFCYFLKKSAFLVKFDIKNGFSDSFPFQKCTFKYFTVIVWKLQHSICFKKTWVHTPP